MELCFTYVDAKSIKNKFNDLGDTTNPLVKLKIFYSNMSFPPISIATTLGKGAKKTIDDKINWHLEETTDPDIDNISMCNAACFKENNCKNRFTFIIRQVILKVIKNDDNCILRVKNGDDIILENPLNTLGNCKRKFYVNEYLSFELLKD